MRSLLKSDLLRGFLSGFALGAAAMVLLSHSDGADSLKSKIEAIPPA